MENTNWKKLESLMKRVSIWKRMLSLAPFGFVVLAIVVVVILANYIIDSPGFTPWMSKSWQNLTIKDILIIGVILRLIGSK